MASKKNSDHPNKRNFATGTNASGKNLVGKKWQNRATVKPDSRVGKKSSA